MASVVRGPYRILTRVRCSNPRCPRGWGLRKKPAKRRILEKIPRHYCSDHCQDTHYRERKRAEREEVVYGCAWSGCGRELPPSRGPGRPREYCSTFCKGAARRGRKPGRAPGQPYPCARRGCAETIPPSQRPGRPHLYCSDSCKEAAAEARGQLPRALSARKALAEVIEAQASAMEAERVAVEYRRSCASWLPRYERLSQGDGAAARWYAERFEKAVKKQRRLDLKASNAGEAARAAEAFAVALNDRLARRAAQARVRRAKVRMTGSPDVSREARSAPLPVVDDEVIESVPRQAELVIEYVPGKRRAERDREFEEWEHLRAGRA